MNNEIKERIKYFKHYVVDNLSLNAQDDFQKILDYITNLQEENERLKENAIHNDKVVDKARWNEMIYKSRNEKAIEYIKECCLYPRIDSHIDGEVYSSMTDNEVKELLNILNGGDDNE